MVYKLALLRSKKGRKTRNSLNFRIYVVFHSSTNGIKKITKIGHFYMSPEKGCKYLYVDKQLLNLWIAKGVAIPNSIWKLLRNF